MRKFLLIIVLSFLITSCQHEALVRNGNIITCKVMAKSQSGPAQEVDFNVAQEIVDSLHVTEEVIIKICNQTILYADWSVKYKPTYHFPGFGLVYFDKESGQIQTSISGSCENAFGVRDNITTTIPFTLTGELVKDSLGLPKIFSF